MLFFIVFLAIRWIRLVSFLLLTPRHLWFLIGILSCHLEREIIHSWLLRLLLLSFFRRWLHFWQLLFLNRGVYHCKILFIVVNVDTTDDIHQRGLVDMHYALSRFKPFLNCLLLLFGSCSCDSSIGYRFLLWVRVSLKLGQCRKLLLRFHRCHFRILLGTQRFGLVLFRLLRRYLDLISLVVSHTGLCGIFVNKNCVQRYNLIVFKIK